MCAKNKILVTWQVTINQRPSKHEWTTYQRDERDHWVNTYHSNEIDNNYPNINHPTPTHPTTQPNTPIPHFHPDLLVLPTASFGSSPQGPLPKHKLGTLALSNPP